MKHIIHFTSTFDKLLSIVKSTSLKLHYSKEEFCLENKKISSSAHPMVSFSEYDITTIDQEIITYGKFGIAFTKNWIEQNRIHQVLYIDKNSLIAKSLADLLIARRSSKKNQLSKEVRMSIMIIKCYTKNTKGYNSRLEIKDFDFKRENEWRFVPSKKQIGGRLISQDRSKYIAKQKYYNQQLEKFPLTFLSSDIEHIFVETEDQKNEILNSISIDKQRILMSKWSTEIK